MAYLHKHVSCFAITAYQAEPPEAAGTSAHNGHITADGLQVDAVVAGDFVARQVLTWQLYVCQLHIL